MLHAALAASITALLIALAGLLYQRRQIHHKSETVRRVIKEKEAVIKLMDKIGDRMTGGMDFNDALQAVLQYIVQATQAQSGAIYLLDDADQTLHARVVVGDFPALFEGADNSATPERRSELILSRHIKVGEGIIGAAVSLEKPLLIADAEADPRIPRNLPADRPIHCLMASPLRARGKTLGALLVVNREDDTVFHSRETLLLHALAEQASLTVDLIRMTDLLAQQQKTERELEVAREFQRMLLPHQLPQIEGYEFAAMNESALMVGGDFYDFIEIDRNHLGIVIADVSGKGIPGALIMGAVRANLRAAARETFSPKEVLRRVNDTILAETQDNVFVTMTYAILDLPNQRLRFVRAGHEPTVVRRANLETDGKPTIESFNPDGVAAGMMPDEIFARSEEVEVQLEPGDSVLLYTDGAVEATNTTSEEYGRERLLDFYRREGARPAQELVSMMGEEIRRYSSGLPQHDDTTLVVLKVAPLFGNGHED